MKYPGNESPCFAMDINEPLSQANLETVEKDKVRTIVERDLNTSNYGQHGVN